MKRTSVYVGCSGFSYRDWKGTFYPSHIDQSQMITYYERFFNVVEINYTFYSMPHPYTINSFLERTSRLRFAIKANSIFTHERDYTKEHLSRFLQGIAPLLESERFIALLFQFPQSFHYSPEGMDYIKKLSLDFRGIDKVIEFRSRSFSRREVFDELEGLGFSLVNVDAPRIKGLFLGPWRTVGTMNYVRLHGRNEDKWYKGEESYERYDYLYSEDELLRIKEKVARLAKEAETYVFFNNHYRGKGALNALQFKELFGEDVSIPKGLRSTFSPKLWE